MASPEAAVLEDLGPELCLRLRRDEPLARHTTFRIGGPADLFITVATIAELVEIAGWARSHSIPLFILGGGSNLLVRDGGIRGLVVENQCRAFEISASEPGKGHLTAESGAPLPLVANQMSRLGWSGLEWGIGVPGTIGGAVIGNAGAHGGSIADTLIEIQVLTLEGQTISLPKNDLAFSYRSSCLKAMNQTLVLSAHFELKHDDPQACIARMNEYTEHRRRTQPTQASVGSIFKNPPGQFSGKLIDEAGLKGKRIGDAEISTVHANFIVNHGSATAAQVLELINLATRAVFEKSGIKLELEIQVIGESG